MTVSVSSWFVSSTSMHLFVNITGGDTVTRIVRSDANGAANVRTPAGTLPKSVSFDFFDYEYSLAYVPGVTVKWTFYNGSTPVASYEFEPYGDENAISRCAFLTVPLRPSLGTVLSSVPEWGDPRYLAVVVKWDSTREATSTFHRVVGRNDPAVVLRAMASRSGTLELRVHDLELANELSAVLARPEVFMLRQSDVTGLEFYFVVSRTSITHDETSSAWPDADPVQWTLRVEFVEVRRPDGDLTYVAGWTYDAVAGGFSSYLDVLGTYLTFADLLENTP